MDGSLLTAIADNITLGMLALIVLGLFWFLYNHVRDCSGHRKDIYGRIDALKDEMHKDSVSVRKDVSEIKESAARIEGMLHSK